MGAGLRGERDQAVAAALGSTPPADQHGPAAATAHDADELSARELEVARLVTAGKTNREIAAELFVSEKTVETHLAHAFAKLGVSSGASLAGVLARGAPS